MYRTASTAWPGPALTEKPADVLSAKGSSISLPGIKRAELLDPLTGARQTLSDDNGIRPTVKPSLQILVW